MRLLQTVLMTLVFNAFCKFTLLGQPNFASGGKLSEAQAAYNVSFYRLSLEIDPELRTLGGTAEILIQVQQPQCKMVVLDLINTYKVSQIWVNEEKTRFTHGQHQLKVMLEKVPAIGEWVSLKVAYSGQPPEAVNPPWQGGFTWSKTPAGKHWVGMSCANEGAKIFFPCKDHPSDRPDSVALDITVPKGYKVAANGILEHTSERPNGHVSFHWFTRYPTTNYNINFTIAPFKEVIQTYTTIAGTEMPVVFYVLPAFADKAGTHLQMAKDMLRFHEELWGEYPFAKEKFGLAHTPYLGMEHQTINAYGNQFRYDTLEGVVFDWLLLHEMGHEWWANKVSVADWADYWIHEGICSYGDALYYERKISAEAFANYLAGFRQRISNQKPIIPRRDANTDEVYQGDIYSKGAYLMHSLRYLMGEASFFTFIYAFANEEAFTYDRLVTDSDFVALANKYSERDLEPFIKQMLYTTILPEWEVKENGKNSYQVFVKDAPMPIPVEVVTSNGRKQYLIHDKPIEIQSEDEPIIDPDHWFLWANDFLK